MNAPIPKLLTVPQRLLGLFVVWQLVFMLGSNLLAFVPHGEPEEGELSDNRSIPPDNGQGGFGQKVIDAAAAIADRWAHLTGQVQAWWLFAPAFPEQATFPVVELRWDDSDRWGRPSVGPVPSQPIRLHSVLEPTNPHAYLRPPGSFDRLFHYEIRLGLLMTAWDADRVQRHPVLWQNAVRTRVRRQWKSMRAYVRWQIQRFQQLHPQLPPPKQAVLLIAIYPTPRPGQAPREYAAPIEQPLARWWPSAPQSDQFLPVEMCDPGTESFLRISMKD